MTDLSSGRTSQISSISRRDLHVNQTFSVGIQQFQFFLLLRMQVQNFDGDCVVVMYCIAINLDDNDRSMRNFNKNIKRHGGHNASPSDQLGSVSISQWRKLPSGEVLD